ncbi:MAG: hypothetical protein ACJ71S_06110 [Acidobacteriaceae bacterium]|jgi:hypothetical protein
MITESDEKWDEQIIVSPENAGGEMLKRARRVHVLRICLEAQRHQGWSDLTTAQLASCYLSDSLEYVSRRLINSKHREIVAPIETIRDGAVVRHAFLGNAAREMYDALVGLSNSACDGRDIPEWLRERLPGIHAAIAKAEGRE